MEKGTIHSDMFLLKRDGKEEQGTVLLRLVLTIGYRLAWTNKTQGREAMGFLFT